MGWKGGDTRWLATSSPMGEGHSGVQVTEKFLREYRASEV